MYTMKIAVFRGSERASVMLRGGDLGPILANVTSTLD
jgi:hypothetical protein